MEGEAKKRGDAMYVVGQIVGRSPEEGLRSNASHAVARRGGKKLPGAKLGLLKMGQDKSEMVTETFDHAIKAGSQENWILFTVTSRTS